MKISRKKVAKRTNKMLAYGNPSNRVPICFEDTLKLCAYDKAMLVQLFLIQQSQLQDIDRKLQLLLEQIAVLNNNRFGKSSEK